MIVDHPWLAFVLAILATWRVTYLVAREDGPFNLLARLRARLGSGFFGTLMDCFTCLSVWIAAPFALLLTRDPLEGVLMWLALSGAACLIERITERPVIFHPQPNPPSTGNSHELLRPTTDGNARPNAIADKQDPPGSAN